MTNDPERGGLSRVRLTELLGGCRPERKGLSMKDELLVRAAQANGHAYPWTMPNGFGERPWNPLTNNEDALVLAVRIGLQVTAYPMYDEPKHSVIVRKPVWDHDAQEGDGVEVVEPYGTDALAATRRAITMCAAELARRKTPNVGIDRPALAGPVE